MRSSRTIAVPRLRASFLHGLNRYGHKCGLDIEDLYAEFGIDPEEARDPLNFVPLAAVGKILEKVAEVLKDDCLGLRLGAQMQGGQSGLLGHLAMSAPTARDALAMLAGYVNVFITNIDCGYEEDTRSGLSVGYWRYPDSIVERRQLNMFTAAAVIQRLREAMDSDWCPTRVDLEHRRPTGCPGCAGNGCEDCDTIVRGILGDRVNFSQPVNRIIHNTAALSRPMRTSSPMAFTLHLDHARKALADMNIGEELVDRVRKEISIKLRKHDNSLHSVAAALGLTPRAMQTQLSQSGTNFDALLAEIREVTARRLLRETDMAITDIAFELGYADPSIFSRAARRWFDQSPRDYRSSHRRQVGRA